MQLLAPHREAGLAATAELITTGQQVLAGECQGQTAWGQCGGLQQFCHKELIHNPSIYATETGVEYVILKTRQPTGTGPPSWCPRGSSQKVRTWRGFSHSSPTGYVVFHTGVVTAGLAEGRESKNPPAQEKGKAGGHRQTWCAFRPNWIGCKTPQISCCTHSGITRAQSPSRLDIKLIKLVMKVGITPSQPTQGR